MAIISKFRETNLVVMQNLIKARGNFGIFSPVCVIHGLIDSTFISQNWRVPESSVYSASESLYRWMNRISDEFNYKHIDQNPWPSNQKCASGL